MIRFNVYNGAPTMKQAYRFHSLSGLVNNYYIEDVILKLSAPGRVAGRKNNLGESECRKLIALSRRGLKVAHLRFSKHRLYNSAFPSPVPSMQSVKAEIPWKQKSYSFLNARTSSHIFLRSRPRGFLAFPFPFPERASNAASISALTSFARAA